MAKQQLKPKDKVVVRMTRDGAVRENLTEGKSEKITKRSEDAQLVKPHEAEAPASPEKPKKRPQSRPEDLQPKPEAQMSPATEDKSEDQPQSDASEKEQPKPEEYKPDELPVSESSSSMPLAPEGHHAAPVDPGSVIAATAVTSSVRKANDVRLKDITDPKMPQTIHEMPAVVRIYVEEAPAENLWAALDRRKEAEKPQHSVLAKLKQCKADAGKDAPKPQLDKKPKSKEMEI